jgi:hypothetical protein
MGTLNHIDATNPDVERSCPEVSRAAGGETLGSALAMAAKRPIPIPSSKRKAAQGALLLAMSILQDERVREQLRRAPVAAREWAEQRRAIDVGTPVGAQRGPNRLERLDPTQRFGQKGVERRLAALERNADLVFPDPTDRDGAVIFQAIDELSRATAISATMPLNERRKTRARITTELTRLERALVDAVLPPDTAAH